MENELDPILERLLHWGVKLGLEEVEQFMISKWQPYYFTASIISGFEKSYSKQMWFDYLDGIFILYLSLEIPGENIPIDKIDALTKQGFAAIIKYLRKQSFQKTVIKRYQFSEDLINLGGGIQTNINAESLFGLNQLVKHFLLSESDVNELRKSQIKKVRENYESFKLDLKEKVKTKSEVRYPHLTATQAGYILHFLMGRDPSFPTIPVRDYESMRKYLEIIGAPPRSPVTVYNKGILFMRNLEKYQHLIKPADIAIIIPILTKIYEPAAITAKSEMGYILLEDRG